MTKEEAYRGGYDYFMQGSSLEANDSRPLTEDQVPVELRAEWRRGVDKASRDSSDYDFEQEEG